MEIKKISVELINPAKYNPRKDLRPGDPEYEKLKRSIEEFGFIEPLVWNRRTGCLVGGHQRYKILLEQGVTEVECSVVDLDEAKEKALNIALNKIGGDWDYQKLAELLEDIKLTGLDVELTGFDSAEIDKLMSDFLYEMEPEEDNFDLEEELEKIEEPVTQKGDIWHLGKHRLLCGDATSAEDVNRLMNGELASMVFTDPPYNVDSGANPRLTNLTTGQSLLLNNIKLDESQSITIDIKPRESQILLNDGSDLFANLAFGSTLWRIQPGRNIIKIELPGSTIQSRIDLAFRPRYLGV
jgi:ParB-like chromosome segregation protein Spo0J